MENTAQLEASSDSSEASHDSQTGETRNKYVIFALDLHYGGRRFERNTGKSFAG
jgi:hypothetical protein